MMNHSCRSLLCEEDHYGEGLCAYWDDCSHLTCHVQTHDFKTWAIYPLCEYCQDELLEYWKEELMPPLTPDEEKAMQREVDAALEQTREQRNRKIQEEIDECPECQEDTDA